MREVYEDERKGRYDEINIHGHNIGDLRYADDTALLSTTTEGLKNLINATKEHSEKKGLLLNIKKTKIMNNDKCGEESKIEIEGEQIENVDHFEYLGARFQTDGKILPEIKRRIAIASQKLTNLQYLWRGQDINMKRKILDTCVFPIALYGCETWTLNKEEMKRIQAFEIKCYRKVLRIPWTTRTTNIEVLERVNLKRPQLIDKIKKLKLKYFGHIKRHQSLERTIMEGDVAGRRGRGRPRRRWEDDIKEWLEKSVTEAGRLATDRAQYRQLIWEATSERIC